MPLYATNTGTPVLVRDLQWAGGAGDAPIPVQAVYSPEDGYSAPVWQRAGAPQLGFSLSPHLVRSDSLMQETLRMALQIQGASTAGATLSVQPAAVNGGNPVIVSGLSNTQGSNVITETFQAPTQDAVFTLSAVNRNGVPAAVSRSYTYGLPPVIAEWTWGSFHQGAGIGVPSSVLLRWRVTGAHPLADIEISPDIAFHPGQRQAGSYRYSRVGTRRDEVLTLTASNVFGSVSRDLTIGWP